MKTIRMLRHLACAMLVAGLLNAGIPIGHQGHSRYLMAQSASDHPGSIELEQYLFVQAPERDNGQHGIVVIWLPAPLQRYCLGRTATQCSNIDYCIRTTNRESSQCRNIGVDLARIPKYPAGTRPSRMLSIQLFYLSPDRFPQLQDFYKSAPRASLERISMSARVKARVRFTRKPDDDDFDLLDVVGVAPF
jgi:hypothetical protein